MYSFKIIIDKKAKDPLTYTGNIVIVAFDKSIGHHHGYNPSDYLNEEQLKKAIQKERKPTAMYPFYVYKEAGLNKAIAISLDRFHRDEKEPTAGYILYFNSTCGEKPLTKNKREIYLRYFLQEYTQFLNGQVYMYVVCDENGQEVHSEGNYYSVQHAKTAAHDTISFLLGEDSFLKNH